MRAWLSVLLSRCSDRTFQPRYLVHPDPGARLAAARALAEVAAAEAAAAVLALPALRRSLADESRAARSARSSSGRAAECLRSMNKFCMLEASSDVEH